MNLLNIYYKQRRLPDLYLAYQLVFDYNYDSFPSYVGNSTLQDQYDVFKIKKFTLAAKLRNSDQ